MCLWLLFQQIEKKQKINRSTLPQLMLCLYMAKRSCIIAIFQYVTSRMSLHLYIVSVCLRGESDSAQRCRYSATKMTRILVRFSTVGRCIFSSVSCSVCQNGGNGVEIKCSTGTPVGWHAHVYLILQGYTCVSLKPFSSLTLSSACFTWMLQICIL